MVEREGDVVNKNVRIFLIGYVRWVDLKLKLFDVNLI